jgi:hypothetical protein
MRVRSHHDGRVYVIEAPAGARVVCTSAEGGQLGVGITFEVRPLLAIGELVQDPD